MARLPPMLAAGLLVGTLLPLGDAAAREVSQPHLARWLEGVEVGRAIEHRLLVVHPLLRSAPTTPMPGDRAAKPEEPVRLGSLAGTDILALGRAAEANQSKIDAVSFAEEPMAFLPGDVIRNEAADFVVTKPAIALTGKERTIALQRISREATDATFAEPQMLAQSLPTPLLYLLLHETPTADLLEASGRWAADTGLTTARHSPAELAEAAKTKVRVADYEVRLAALPALQRGAGQVLVGCAAVLDGAPVLFETLPDAASFALAWPRVAKALAVEAAVLELKNDLIDQPMSPPADPDRFVSAVKQRLLEVFGARTSATDVRDAGSLVRFALDGAIAQALVLPVAGAMGGAGGGTEDRVVHFVLVTDPARRTEKPHEDPEPGPASRKSRPTEEEKRLLGRRQGGIPTPAPAPPPDPPK